MRGGRTLEENTAIALDEADQAIVIAEPCFPYKRPVTEDPHHHFFSSPLPSPFPPASNSTDYIPMLK